MLSDRNGLKAFFLEIAGERAELVSGEIALLEPLCRKADNGFFDLAPAREVDKRDVLAAVGAACGDRPSDVTFVSLQQGVEDWERTDADLGDDVRESVCRCFKEAFIKRLGSEAHTRLEQAFWETLGEPLWHSFEQNRWDDAGLRICHSVRATLLATAVHYLGFVAVGDTENAERLRPLLRLYSKTAVLGRRKAEPGTLISVVA